ncbi:MAG TPA: hypothetical protein DCK93_11090 [Blastocatellia bacterium]|jgi:hypothetical protein|nr:hypothetical protein [Blastocatellia bacterium]
MLKTLIFLSVVLSCWGCSKSVTIGPNNRASQTSSTAAGPQNAAGDLHNKAPDGWKAETPTSNMRVAEFKLPKVEGDSEDAQLVLYYFGPGQGGTAQANIDRWINQMQQPDGHPSKERAKTETLTVNNLSVTTVDVLGTYNGGMAPPGGGMPAATPGDMSNYRLRAAVIETPKGSYFVKLTGPQKTISRWDQAYTDYIKSFEFK